MSMHIPLFYAPNIFPLIRRDWNLVGIPWVTYLYVEFENRYWICEMHIDRRIYLIGYRKRFFINAAAAAVVDVMVTVCLQWLFAVPAICTAYILNVIMSRWERVPQTKPINIFVTGMRSAMLQLLHWSNETGDDAFDASVLVEPNRFKTNHLLYYCRKNNAT